MAASSASSSSAAELPWTGLAAAFAAPAIYAVVNLLDKHVLDKRVRSTEGYLLLIGVLSAAYAAALGLVAPWSGGGGGASLAGYLWAALSGFLFGVAGLFYYFALSDESASSVVALEYFYPVVICVLGATLLHERVTALMAVGIAAATLGACLLGLDISCSKRRRRRSQEATETSPLREAEDGASSINTAEGDGEKAKAKMPAWKFLLLTTCLVCCTATYEFAYKLATDRGVGSIAIAAVCYGVLCVTLVAGSGLVVLAMRGPAAAGALYAAWLPDEARRNVLWALLNEGLTLSTVMCTIVAMGKLPASLVAPLGAVQPLYVLLLESLWHRDWRTLLRKLVPILLTTAGVVLLGLFGIG